MQIDFLPQDIAILNKLAAAVAFNAKDKGFQDAIKNLMTDEQWNGELGALVRAAVYTANLHGEASEFWEAFRKSSLSKPCDKAERMTELGLPPLTGAEEEIADILIRTRDQAQAHGVDVSKAVAVKMRYNRTRPSLHGGKRALAPKMDYSRGMAISPSKAQALAEGRAWAETNPDLVAQGFKRCRRCKKVALASEAFTKEPRCKGGYRNLCKTCHNETHVKSPEAAQAAHTKWRENNPEKYKESQARSRKKRAVKVALLGRRRTLRRYGLSSEDYDRMVEAQGGVCVICRLPPTKGKGERLHVDHCHKTGKVRALLCSDCNRALGYFRDDLARVVQAAEYLRQHQEMP